MDKLKHFLISIKEFYIPAGRRIPYRVFVVPLMVVFLLILTSSIIRGPSILSPEAGSSISRTPVFKFSVVKNLFYKDYAVKLRYADSADGGSEIQITVFEEGEAIVVTTPSTLRKRAEVELLITINKGIGPLGLWSKTFSYRFETTQ